MKHLIAFLAICFPLFTLLAAQLPVALPPFTFTGRITDYRHAAYDATVLVEVRVKAIDGTLLAKTRTSAGGETAFNYAIDIPLASTALSGHVKVGDAVVFEFAELDDMGNPVSIYTGLVPSGSAIVGNPGAYRTLDVTLAVDSDGDGVPDQYVDELENEMYAHGKTEYDAQADWDNDGQSNYAEYVAGTDPFDPTDRFAVREMSDDTRYDGYVALRVLVSQGRTYAVETTESLGTDAVKWTVCEFALGDPADGLQTVLTTGPSEIGYRTLYVRKSGASRFWQLTVR